MQLFPLVLPAHKNEALASILKVFVTDSTIEMEENINQLTSPLLCGSSEPNTLQNISGIALSFESSNIEKNSCSDREKYHCSDPKEKNATENNTPGLNNTDDLEHDSSDFKDNSVIRDELSDAGDKKATKRDSPGSTDKACIKCDSSDLQDVESMTQHLSQPPFLKLVSQIRALARSESINSATKSLETCVEELLPKVSALADLADAAEYYERTNNEEQIAKIGLKAFAQFLPLVQCNPCHNGEKLIGDAIKAKENNKASCAIRHLDVASQLPLKWTQKVKVF